jgi:hypothetical protein
MIRIRISSRAKICRATLHYLELGILIKKAINEERVETLESYS